MFQTLTSNSPFSAPRDDTARARCGNGTKSDFLSLKAEAALGEATLELSVLFLDSRESPGEPVRFICRAAVFAGSPDAILADWPLTQKESLASGSGGFESMGASPRSRHQVTTKVLLPPQADFAVVHLVAHKPKNPRGTEAVFGE
jgi:hypothetical protein